MEALTFEQLLGAAVVILVLIGAYNTIMKAVQTHREEKRIKDSPIAELQSKVAEHDELLRKDKGRLEALEMSVNDMRHESTIMLRGVRALLSHEINGNSDDKLRASMTEIDDYLIQRK